MSKKPGRKSNEVWAFYEKTPLKSSPGHFSAICMYCKKKWTRGYVEKLQAHFANECNKCPDELKNYWLKYLINDDSSSNSASASSSKKRKTGGQLEIEDFYESRNLPESKVESINKALVRAFVCCGIPFSVIDNPFFRELLYQL